MSAQTLHRGVIVPTGEVTYTAECPQGGHDALWISTPSRVDAHNGPVALSVDCLVCSPSLEATA